MYKITFLLILTMIAIALLLTGDLRAWLLSGLILWPLSIMALFCGYAFLLQIAVNTMPDSEDDS